MIKTFRDRDTAELFGRQPIRRLHPEIQRAARAKLLILDAATELEDLRTPPGNRLEALRGDRAGQYSIRVNSRWRVCFAWADGHAYEVEIVDYH